MGDPSRSLRTASPRWCCRPTGARASFGVVPFADAGAGPRHIVTSPDGAFLYVTLNKDGRIIGLAFDGNIHSTGGSYGFDPELNRMVSVSSQAIVGALRHIYGATALADELVK